MSSYKLANDAPVDTRFVAFNERIKPWAVYSQNYEEAIIAAILNRIGVKHYYCVEAGAADGKFMSNTRLLTDAGWKTLLVEPDADDFAKLKEQFGGNPKVHLRQCLLAAKPEGEHETTIDGLLASVNAPEDPDVFVLDIDSAEYFLTLSMVRYKPRVFVVEFDPDTDPMFIPEHRGKGQAGQMALRYACEARGYDVICRTATNLICVRKDLSPMLMEPGERVQAGANDGDESDCQWFTMKTQSRGLTADLTRLDFVTEKQGCNNKVIPGQRFCATHIELPSSKRGESPIAPATETPQRFQVFAAGRWQETGDGLKVEVLPEELDAANAGKLPTRALTSETRPVRIAACMSIPRLGYLDAYDGVVTALQHAGISRSLAFGVYWHHSLSRGVERILEPVDHNDEPFDYVLLIDYDSFVTPDDVIALATTLAAHPEADAIVPMQIKRGGNLELLAEMNGRDLTQDLVLIESGHFGFTLFRREFFEKLPKPWFRESSDPDGGWNDGRCDADIGFWRNAKEAGLKTYMATKIIIGHGEEVVSYPRIVGGKIEKIYQSTIDWRNTKERPAGIGVIR